MKRRKIKDFNESVYIYRPDEKEKFCKDYDLTIGKNDVGMSCGNGVWIGVVKVWACAHEVTHFVDWLLEKHLRIPAQTLEATTELRAYMVGNITEDVWDYVKT